MTKTRFWKAGQKGCDQMVTTAWTMGMLKVLGYVPVIDWSFVIPAFVIASVLAIVTGALASYYADIERETERA